MVDHWYFLSLNPEPWAVGDLSLGRRNNKLYPKMSPNLQLRAYQDAVRESLAGQSKLDPGVYSLEFYFWRTLSQYQGKFGRVRKHQTDVTNLQKALEDALQDVLFDNDRNVQDIHSTIVAQSGDTEPRILIKASSWEGLDESTIPDHAWALMDQVKPKTFQNAWGDEDDQTF